MLGSLGRVAGLWVGVVLVLGVGACKGGGGQTTPDTGVNDAPADNDVPTGNDAPTGDDVPVAPDGPGDTSPATDAGVTDGPAPTDGPTVECAPGPTGGTVPAGTAPMQDAGPSVTSTATRPELADDVAAQYTVKKALAQGFNITYGDGGVPPVTYSLNDNWDPQTNGIGDPATFTPTFTVAPDGSGNQPSLNSAFNAANALGACGRVYIRLLAGEHRAIAQLASKTSGPAVTVYSTESDASKTVIVFNNATATVGSMSNSATLTIKAIRGFQMKNLTVANDYVEGSMTGNQSAVAMLLQSDQSQFENVRFLGNIGTLYLKSASENVAARSYFRDCYIEGDQDFILGRGTAVFDHCEIKVLSTRVTTGLSIGYPSTLVFNRYGFLFDSCKFTGDTGAAGVAFARQWVEQGDTTATNGWAVGKMVVRNSTLGAHLAGAAPWSSTGARTTTPKDPAGTTPVILYNSDDYFAAGVGPAPAEPFLGEYRNSGAGAHQ
jgi:pectinesterase